jgi:hypothetical protein
MVAWLLFFFRLSTPLSRHFMHVLTFCHSLTAMDVINEFKRPCGTESIRTLARARCATGASASPVFRPQCPTDLWLDLLDSLSGDAVAATWVRQALHVHSFGPADVCSFCMPWLPDPFCCLPACPHAGCAAVCSVLACYVLLIGASVAAAAAPAGARAFADGQCTVACAFSRCRSRPVLPGVAPPPSAPSGVPSPKPSSGKAWSPISFFF